MVGVVPNPHAAERSRSKLKQMLKCCAVVITSDIVNQPETVTMTPPGERRELKMDSEVHVCWDEDADEAHQDLWQEKKKAAMRGQRCHG